MSSPLPSRMSSSAIHHDAASRRGAVGTANRLGEHRAAGGLREDIAVDQTIAGNVAHVGFRPHPLRMTDGDPEPGVRGAPHAPISSSSQSITNVDTACSSTTYPRLAK